MTIRQQRFKTKFGAYRKARQNVKTAYPPMKIKSIKRGKGKYSKFWYVTYTDKTRR